MRERGARRKPLTRFGFEQLAAEYERLAKHERPQVLEAIQRAAAEGDRSENAEYIYGRKKLRELDRRLRYLAILLKDVQIIDESVTPVDRIGVGSFVVLETGTGQVRRWRLVGEGESHFFRAALSWKSPVGRALCGRRVGDWIEVQTPGGLSEFEVLAIERQPYAIDCV